MASKHKREEVKDFEGVAKPLGSANVRGVISSLSPIKKGRKSNYFEGTVSDGKSKLHLVGFSQAQQKQMQDLKAQKKAVQFEDCEIKQARSGVKMEIMLKGQTTISESAKTFDVASIDFEDDSPSSVTLSELDSTNIWDRVSVDVKVLTVMDPVSVPGGKRKQGCHGC